MMLQFKKINLVLNKKPILFSFIVFFTTMLVFLLNSNFEPFYWDSGQYWNLSKDFIKNNHFSILNYNENLRGVWFPLILFPINQLSSIFQLDALMLIRIFNALFISLFAGVLVPKIIKRIYPKTELTFVKILFFCFLLFFFWRNFFHYPLSDFISFSFLFLSFYFLLSNKYYQIMLSGLFLGIAVSIRPIYIISLLPFVSYLLLIKYKHLHFKKPILIKLIKISILIAFFYISSIPQVAINFKNKKSLSPLIKTENSGYGKSLYLQQLIWGLRYQKYETNVGSSYPSASVFFFDKKGGEIANKENVDLFTKYSDFIKIVFKYPVDLLFLYTNHIFNAMDIKDSSPYLKVVTGKNYFFSIFNYSIIFVFFLLFYFIKNQLLKNIESKVFLVFTFLPILFIIPTAIECRFFIPFFILMYAFIAFLPNYKELYNSLNKDLKIKIVLLYIAFICMCLMLSYTTYMNTQFEIL